MFPLLHQAAYKKAKTDHDDDEEAGSNQTENEELARVLDRLCRCNYKANKSIIKAAHFVCTAIVVRQARWARTKDAIDHCIHS